MYNEVDFMILESFLECPECDSKEFTLESHATTIVAAPSYEDEHHHRHEHDGNCMEAFYSCTNRHLFCVKPINSCWCGWKQNMDCKCVSARWEDFVRRGKPFTLKRDRIEDEEADSI